MNVSKPVTPSEARAVWSRIPNPSARRVARALSQAGRPIHHSTVARWRLEGWRSVAKSPHLLKASRQALDVTAGVLTGDPVADAEIIARQPGSREELETLTDTRLPSSAIISTCRLVHSYCVWIKFLAPRRFAPALILEILQEGADEARVELLQRQCRWRDLQSL